MVLHRLPAEQPRRLPTPPHVLEQEVEWEAIEGELAKIDAVQPQPPVEEQPINYELIAYTLVMLGNAQNPH